MLLTYARTYTKRRGRENKRDGMQPLREQQGDKNQTKAKEPEIDRKRLRKWRANEKKEEKRERPKDRGNEESAREKTAAKRKTTEGVARQIFPLMAFRLPQLLPTHLMDPDRPPSNPPEDGGSTARWNGGETGRRR